MVTGRSPLFTAPTPATDQRKGSPWSQAMQQFVSSFEYSIEKTIMKRMSQPMREPTLLILSALAAGPSHGYALLFEVTEVSDGEVTLRPGTLYAALDRLTAEGLVRVAGEKVVEGRLRRLYDLTPIGADALRTETRRLRRRAARAEQRLSHRTATALGL